MDRFTEMINETKGEQSVGRSKLWKKMRAEFSDKELVALRRPLTQEPESEVEEKERVGLSVRYVSLILEHFGNGSLEKGTFKMREPKTEEEKFFVLDYKVQVPPDDIKPTNLN